MPNNSAYFSLGLSRAMAILKTIDDWAEAPASGGGNGMTGIALVELYSVTQ
jgi:hypothetical protein